MSDELGTRMEPLALGLNNSGDGIVVFEGPAEVTPLMREADGSGDGELGVPGRLEGVGGKIAVVIGTGARLEPLGFGLNNCGNEAVVFEGPTGSDAEFGVPGRSEVFGRKIVVGIGVGVNSGSFSLFCRYKFLSSYGYEASSA